MDYHTISISNTSDAMCVAVSQMYFFKFIIVMFQCIINHFRRGLIHSDASTGVFE